MAQRNDLAQEMYEHVFRLRESGMGKGLGELLWKV